MGKQLQDVVMWGKFCSLKIKCEVAGGQLMPDCS